MPQPKIPKQEKESPKPNEEFVKQIEELKKTSEDFKNRYLRALADYKNLEHRVSQERQQVSTQIKKQLIVKFLNILDHIDQAEIFTKDAGLQMVAAQFRSTLKELNVEELELVGREYDPHVAEVVDVVSGKEDNIVVEVVQKAYSLNGEIIRPGRVRVGKKAENSP